MHGPAAASPARQDPASGHAERSLLRFIACGSVDDGKSTLLGRLLHETQALTDDQLSSLDRDSRKFGTAGDEMDLALALDGLEAERAQGITIDVAYRYFSTTKRKFIVADTPGHEQYTRNMATGASTADLAILLVDARKGPTVQTRRHATIVSLLGIRHIVVAVNKMDLVGWSQTRYRAILNEASGFLAPLGFSSIVAIPLAARTGDNVAALSSAAPWYRGPALLDHLERVDIAPRADGPFRLPIQLALRPNADYRGYAGRITGGTARVGDAVAILPSGVTTQIAGIDTAQGPRDIARDGESVTLRFAREIDATRGDVVVPADARPPVAGAFSAHLVWMSGDAARAGDRLLIKSNARVSSARIVSIDARLDPATGKEAPAEALALNDIARVTLAVERPIVAEPYRLNRETGGFILIDRESNDTLGAGMIVAAKPAAGEATKPAAASTATVVPLLRPARGLLHRGLLKAMSWRLVGTLATIAIALLLTGNVALALTIGAIEVVAKSLLFVAHERAWQRLPFGSPAKW